MLNMHIVAVSKWLLSVLLTSSFIKVIRCKGIAVIGAASGDRQGKFDWLIDLFRIIHFGLLLVCVECGGNYTQEEMNMALCIVGMILGLFFSILACQCYSRVMWEYFGDADIKIHHKYMPPPPYSKRSVFLA